MYIIKYIDKYILDGFLVSRKNFAMHLNALERTIILQRSQVSEVWSNAAETG
jgi:hypothetical protein